jgi:hypothetical protein
MECFQRFDEQLKGKVEALCVDLQKISRQSSSQQLRLDQIEASTNTKAEDKDLLHEFGLELNQMRDQLEQHMEEQIEYLRKSFVEEDMRDGRRLPDRLEILDSRFQDRLDNLAQDVAALRNGSGASQVSERDRLKQRILELFPTPMVAMPEEEFKKTKCESLLRHMITQIKHKGIEETIRELRRMKDGAEKSDPALRSRNWEILRRLVDAVLEF